MKIKVFVRHCKFSSNSAHKNNRPHYFTREGCFNNLLNTIDKDCDVTVSFDGNLTESDHFLNKDIYKGKFNLFQKKGGNDGSSFLNMIEYVNTLQFDDNDIIYFLEDDYFHNIGWTNIVREGFESVAVDYITLYDHNDKYWYPMYEQLMSKVICTKNIHWKSIPNTTNTYACLAKTFKRDYHIHKMYCDLTKGYTRDFDKFMHLTNEGKTLINPLPGYCTHCEMEYMSPVVDWETAFNKTCKL
jgi:hypothetical protein